MCNAFLLKNSEPCENNAIYFRGSSLSYIKLLNSSKEILQTKFWTINSSECTKIVMASKGAHRDFKIMVMFFCFSWILSTMHFNGIKHSVFPFFIPYMYSVIILFIFKMFTNVWINNIGN